LQKGRSFHRAKKDPVSSITGKISNDGSLFDKLTLTGTLQEEMKELKAKYLEMQEALETS
jgi:hypothetical protein